jgi:vacuolar-type H+-ATPase subunit E/Vma4
MALADMLEKLKKEANTKLEEVDAEFVKQKKQLEADFEKDKSQIKEDIDNKVKMKSKKMMDKTDDLADRERKNENIMAKRQIIDEALEEATKQLNSSDKYEEIITNMLKASTLNSDNVTVVASVGKEDETKRAIKASGKDYKLEEHSAQLGGGIAIKTSKIEIDNSFKTIVNSRLRDDLEIKLNKLLFS